MRKCVCVKDYYKKPTDQLQQVLYFTSGSSKNSSKN